MSIHYLYSCTGEAKDLRKPARPELVASSMSGVMILSVHVRQNRKRGNNDEVNETCRKWSKMAFFLHWAWIFEEATWINDPHIAWSSKKAMCFNYCKFKAEMSHFFPFPISYPKISWGFIHAQARHVSSWEKIWRKLAFHHFLTNGWMNDAFI